MQNPLLRKGNCSVADHIDLICKIVPGHFKRMHGTLLIYEFPLLTVNTQYPVHMLLSCLFFALWTEILFHVTHYGPVQGPAEFSGETCVVFNRAKPRLCARSSVFTVAVIRN